MMYMISRTLLRILLSILLTELTRFIPGPTTTTIIISYYGACTTSTCV